MGKPSPEPSQKNTGKTTLAKQVSEETAKQVTEAVLKHAEAPAPAKKAPATPEKKPTSAAPAAPGPSEKYIKKEESAAKAKKEVKDSIDSILGKEERPVEAVKAIDALAGAGPLSPPPPTLEGVAQDAGAAYQRNQSKPVEDPTRFYQGARAQGSSTEGDPRGAYLNRSPGGEDGNPQRAYANQDQHGRATNAQGQRDAFGNEELSLSGRIQKMYSK